jgi:hypothetical protein
VGRGFGENVPKLLIGDANGELRKDNGGGFTEDSLLESSSRLLGKRRVAIEGEKDDWL